MTHPVRSGDMEQLAHMTLQQISSPDNKLLPDKTWLENTGWDTQHICIPRCQ